MVKGVKEVLKEGLASLGDQIESFEKSKKSLENIINTIEKNIAHIGKKQFFMKSKISQILTDVKSIKKRDSTQNSSIRR